MISGKKKDLFQEVNKKIGYINKLRGFQTARSWEMKEKVRILFRF